MTAADVRLQQLTRRIQAIWPRAKVELVLDIIAITIPGEQDVHYWQLERLANAVGSTKIDLSHEAGEPNHRTSEVTPDLRPGNYVITVKPKDKQ